MCTEHEPLRSQRRLSYRVSIRDRIRTWSWYEQSREHGHVIFLYVGVLSIVRQRPSFACATACDRSINGSPTPALVFRYYFSLLWVLWSPIDIRARTVSQSTLASSAPRDGGLCFFQPHFILSLLLSSKEKASWSKERG
jgi:hypothetical protein